MTTSGNQIEKQNASIAYLTHTGEEIQLSVAYVRSQFCPQATPAEAFSFISVCRSHKLNPILREAYLVKYASNMPAQVVLSYTVWVQRAASDPSYEGYEAGIAVLDKEGNIVYRKGGIALPSEQLLGGWCEVQVKNRNPVRVEVALTEYDQGNTQWKRKPATMIIKTAIKQSHQMAFPSLFQGLDMGDSDGDGEPLVIIDSDYNVIDEPPRSANNNVASNQNNNVREPEPEPEHEKWPIPERLSQRVSDAGIDWDGFLDIIGASSWQEWRESGKTAVDAWNLYEERKKEVPDDIETETNEEDTEHDGHGDLEADGNAEDDMPIDNDEENVDTDSNEETKPLGLGLPWT